MSQITIDNLIDVLNGADRLGSVPATVKHELIGEIDPFSPDLTASERLLVLRACKQSKPFFMWMLRQLIIKPPAEPKDVLWGTVSLLINTTGPLTVMLNELLARSYPILRGKSPNITCWMFESGHLCIVATYGDNGKTYKHVAKVSADTLERVGAKFKPAGVRGRHIAGLFDRSWVGFMSNE